MKGPAAREGSIPSVADDPAVVPIAVPRLPRLAVAFECGICKRWLPYPRVSHTPCNSIDTIFIVFWEAGLQECHNRGITEHIRIIPCLPQPDAEVL